MAFRFRKRVCCSPYRYKGNPAKYRLHRPRSSFLLLQVFVHPVHSLRAMRAILRGLSLPSIVSVILPNTALQEEDC
jgi:hypothetical protein